MGNFEPVRTKADLDTLDEADMIDGYTSAQRGDPEPGPNRGRACWHGWHGRGTPDVTTPSKETTTMTIAIPTIHLNGTSRESLLEGLCKAVHALHEAGRKLAATYPNGRDYYPQGVGALTPAMNQHDARMNKLREIINELETIAMALCFGELEHVPCELPADDASRQLAEEVYGKQQR